jgi:hypothetical protein
MLNLAATPSPEDSTQTTAWALECSHFCVGIMSRLMLCDEKVRLVQEWSRTVEEYSQAVAKLNSKSVTSAQELASLKILVNDCRCVAERARLAFESHVSEHSC